MRIATLGFVDTTEGCLGNLWNTPPLGRWVGKDPTCRKGVAGPPNGFPERPQLASKGRQVGQGCPSRARFSGHACGPGALRQREPTGSLMHIDFRKAALAWRDQVRVILSTAERGS